jgi:HEPN domain-containing protein
MAKGRGVGDGSRVEGPAASAIVETSNGQWNGAMKAWIIPELARRGLPADTPFRAALVLLGKWTSHHPARVLLNEPWLLTVSGDPPTLNPKRLPGEPWFAMLVADGLFKSSFDFTWDRPQPKRCLNLAQEFLEASRQSLAAGLTRPAVEAAWAAAELSVDAQLRLHQPYIPGPEHTVRKAMWEEWQGWGNAPAEYVRVLDQLSEARAWSRYGEEQPGLEDEAARNLLATVAEMVEFARRQVEPRPEDYGRPGLPDPGWVQVGPPMVDWPGRPLVQMPGEAPPRAPRRRKRAP